jgi:hypothetical protein
MRGGHTICGVKAPAHQGLCTLRSVVTPLRRACAQVARVLTCPLVANLWGILYLRDTLLCLVTCLKSVNLYDWYARPCASMQGLLRPV